MNWFTTFIRSVYAKLIVICLVTWVCIVVVAVSLVAIHKRNSLRPFHTNAIQYFSYVIEDLGSPPDRARAEALYNKTGLKISYKGEREHWSFIKDFPEENDIRYRTLSGSTKVFLGRFHGRYFFKNIHESGVFIFEPAGYNQGRDKYLWALLFSLTLIVTGAYFAMKKILSPIGWLHQGVQEVGSGNLAHTLPENRKDEFGKLAAAFNTMTGRLRQMLDLKHQLLRDVSHELRSPLTRMKVALEFLDDDQVKKSIGTDIREVETMVTAILENARLHHNHATLEQKRADLTELVKDIISGFENRSPGIHFPAHSPVIFRFDPDRIKTVLTNILENALKYSTRESRPMEVHLKKEADRIRITVEDNGMGMDKSKLPLILEPFYRLDKSRSKKTGGFGLGLPLCKTIMDAHGGKMEISSSPGAGTRVTLFLPAE